MRWTVHRPFLPGALRDRVDRLTLRRRALHYAGLDWPVTPGAWLTGHRFSCGRPGCPITTAHPALASGPDTASTDPDRVRQWWRHRPHTILLATGTTFDALEVPATLGLRALGAARLHGAARGPVAVTPAGRWLFLVRPGTLLRADLDNRFDVVRHGRGSWIPAPPSRMLEGAVRWAVAPERAQWRMPAADVVQGLLADALGATRVPYPIVPRQVSTARRGG